MTEPEILEGLVTREGGWRDAQPRENAPDDPPTNFGITLPTLQQYKLRYLGTPVQDTSIETLRDLTALEAQQIYQIEFVHEPGFLPENIPFEPLRVQLIDFGVNSGPARAIRWLQRVLGMPKESQTGVLDPATKWSLTWATNDPVPSKTILRYHLINDALVAARSYMIDQAVDQGTMRKQDEEGVESRALRFFLAKP